MSLSQWIRSWFSIIGSGPESSNVVAIAGEFDLKVFQSPSGTDLLKLAGSGAH